MESEAFFENLHGFLTVKEGVSKIIPSFFTIKEGSASLTKPLLPEERGCNRPPVLRTAAL